MKQEESETYLHEQIPASKLFEVDVKSKVFFDGEVVADCSGNYVAFKKE